MITVAEFICAVCLDRLFGEPTKAHPLVGFGTMALKIEAAMLSLIELDSSSASSRIWANLLGAISIFLAIAPPVVVTCLMLQFESTNFLLSITVLYLTIGARSLAEHARTVENELVSGNLERARANVALIVSRNTQDMEFVDVARAAIESVLENGNDAIFGAIFWFLLLGPVGAVIYRLANTLDAMWGYKSKKYIHFGWAAARLDDLLNLLPARITALTYALVGNFSSAIKCWRTQAKSWYSPNAGPVMSAGAGALEVSLGGAATYHGQLKQRPKLGVGSAPSATDIGRAVRLVEQGIKLWITVALICALIQ